MAHTWCSACEQNVGSLVNHKARCGLTCDAARKAEFFSGHTPVPGTLRRHFSMDDCQKTDPYGAPCPKKRRTKSV
jgi:hypothetical protein